MKADKQLIEWLLYNSEETIYSIEKNSKVAKSTISDLRSRKSNIERMSFKNASLLSDYASKVKGKRNVSKNNVIELRKGVEYEQDQAEVLHCVSEEDNDY